MRLSGFPDYLTITLETESALIEDICYGGYMKFCTFHLSISCSLVVIFVFQGFASSAEIAHMESQKKPQDRRSFLLGAVSKVKSLPMNEKSK